MRPTGISADLAKALYAEQLQLLKAAATADVCAAAERLAASCTVQKTTSAESGSH